MKKMLLVVALLTIAGIEAKSKTKPTRNATTSAGRPVGGNPSTWTPDQKLTAAKNRLTAATKRLNAATTTAKKNAAQKAVNTARAAVNKAQAAVNAAQ